MQLQQKYYLLHSHDIYSKCCHVKNKFWNIFHSFQLIEVDFLYLKQIRVFKKRKTPGVGDVDYISLDGKWWTLQVLKIVWILTNQLFVKHIFRNTNSSRKSNWILNGQKLPSFCPFLWKPNIRKLKFAKEFIYQITENLQLLIFVLLKKMR